MVAPRKSNCAIGLNSRGSIATCAIRWAIAGGATFAHAMHICHYSRPKQAGRLLVVLHIQPSRSYARIWHLGRARSPMPSRRRGRPFSYGRAPRCYSAFSWAARAGEGRSNHVIGSHGWSIPVENRSLAPALPLRRHAVIVQIYYIASLPYAAPTRGTTRTARHGADAQTPWDRSR